MSIEAMKLALKALEADEKVSVWDRTKLEVAAILALKKAIADEIAKDRKND
jgi:hypothetical protein